jgi:hypothetical protein
MLSVIMVNVANNPSMLSIIMLSVIMLNVVMLRFVAPLSVEQSSREPEFKGSMKLKINMSCFSQFLG